MDYYIYLQQPDGAYELLLLKKEDQRTYNLATRWTRGSNTSWTRKDLSPEPYPWEKTEGGNLTKISEEEATMILFMLTETV